MISQLISSAKSRIKRSSILSHLAYQAIRAIPVPVQYGRTFIKYKSFLEKSQHWSKGELEDFQLSELSSLLKHAFKNVPYYNNLFTEEKIKPSDIDDFDRLYLIPPLTKEIIQGNFLKLKAKNYPEDKFEYVTTGGSTGTPTPFYYEKGRSNPFEMAFHWRYRRMIGIKYSDEYIALTGFNNFEKSKFDGSNWQYYDLIRKTLFLSSYNLTDYYLQRYVKVIQNRPISVLFGYPSSLYSLAKYLKDNDIFLENIKIVHTGSENLFEFQKNQMQERFKAKVFDHYGNSERCVLIHQCANGKLYHVIPEYGITEIMNDEDKPLKSEGEIGQIYATGFINYAFPFIRYKTEDFVEFSGEKCPCGRNFLTINSIKGRIQEFLITKDLRKISLTAINFHGKEFDNIKQIQFYQDKVGYAEIRIVPDIHFKKKNENKIFNALKKKLGNDFQSDIKYVNTIERTNDGKYRWVDQKLKDI